MVVTHHTLTESTTIECPDVGLTYSVLWPTEDFPWGVVYASVWDDSTGERLCPKHN